MVRYLEHIYAEVLRSLIEFSGVCCLPKPDLRVRSHACKSLRCNDVVSVMMHLNRGESQWTRERAKQSTQFRRSLKPVSLLREKLPGLEQFQAFGNSVRGI